MSAYDAGMGMETGRGATAGGVAGLTRVLQDARGWMGGCVFILVVVWRKLSTVRRVASAKGAC